SRRRRLTRLVKSSHSQKNHRSRARPERLITGKRNVNPARKYAVTQKRNHQPREVSMDLYESTHRFGGLFAHGSPSLRRDVAPDHWDRGNQLAHNIERLFALDLGLGTDDQSMAEHAGGHGLNVLMREVRPAIQQGPAAGTAEQAERRARAGTKGDVGMTAA